MNLTRLAISVGVWMMGAFPVAAQSGIAFGLTNTPLGTASIYGGDNYITAGELGSEGRDGVSVHLGEADSGFWFWTGTGAFDEGNYMRANIYGRLNGSNDVLLASIQGGSAGAPIYPLEVDLSALGPESLTFQLFYSGILQKEFTQSNGMAVVETDWATYPQVNPLVRKPDGTLGVSMHLDSAVQFVFPEALISAFADELFIRANRPANRVEFASRMDLIGGGGVLDFYLNGGALGMFGRPHESSGGAMLQAAGGQLRVSDLTNTNDVPGVLIRAEPASAFSLDFLPVGLSASNSFLNAFARPGAVELQHFQSEITISLYNHDDRDATRLVILADGNIVHSTQGTGVSVPTNTLIRGFRVQAKTFDALPGFHVRLAQTTAIRIGGQPSIDGDEIRFELPAPARVETVGWVFLGGRIADSITITNEATFPLEPPPRLDFVRFGNYLKFTWPDPNRVYEFQESGFLESGHQRATNEIMAVDPYAILTLQIDRANPARFYRLQHIAPD